jgi:hypothetical protein
MGITHFADASHLTELILYAKKRMLLADPEARVRFPALPEKESSGSLTGST